MNRPGVLQLRKFDQIAQKYAGHDYQQGITDVYIHRRGHTDIGVKFRNPDPRDYGWKLRKFQCKLATSQVYQQLYMERWQKYQLKLADKVKLRTKGIQADYKQ